MWLVGEGSLGPEIKGSCSPLGPRDPAAAGVPYSMVERVQVGGGDARAWGRGYQTEWLSLARNPQKEHVRWYKTQARFRALWTPTLRPRDQALLRGCST